MTFPRIVLGLSLGVVSCTSAPPRNTPGDEVPTPPGPVASVSALGTGTTSSTYELLTPEQTGVVQVFDDAKDTYLQFGAFVPAGLWVFDQDGHAVTFTVCARAVVVGGVHAGLLLRTSTRSSYAQLPRASRSPAPGASLAEEGRALPEDLVAARAEILVAEARLREVSAHIDQASQGDPVVPLGLLRADLETIQTWIDGVSATLMRAHFAVASAVVKLSGPAQRTLLEAASRADEIHIRGGADASGPVAVNEALARARASSMRRLLIDGGIDAVKVHASGTRAEYIATNTTSDGRAQNRRVDVVFSNRTGLKVPMANKP